MSWMEGQNLTALHRAVLDGDRDLVSRLLAEGADANTAIGNGATPLHFSAASNQVVVAELLVAAGASVDARDNCECPPLHWAAIKGHAEAAEFLLANGADVNATCALGGTALHHCAVEAQPDVARVLLAQGADVDARCKRGGTPLHHAAAQGHLEVAQLLLANGAEASCRDNDGWTPLDLAESAETPDPVADLLRGAVTLADPAPSRGLMGRQHTAGLGCGGLMLLFTTGGLLIQGEMGFVPAAFLVLVSSGIAYLFGRYLGREQRVVLTCLACLCPACRGRGWHYASSADFLRATHSGPKHHGDPEYYETITCPRCGGTGRKPGPCSDCGGSGQIVRIE